MAGEVGDGEVCPPFGVDDGVGRGRVGEDGGGEDDRMSLQEVARSDEVDDAVASALSSRTSAEWDDRFHAAGVVGGGVRTLAEVIATGQPDARELFSDVDARFGPTRVTNAGYLVDGEPLVPAFGPPMLGEHSQDVLASLGYSAVEIDTLVAGGVIGSPRA